MRRSTVASLLSTLICAVQLLAQDGDVLSVRTFSFADGSQILFESSPAGDEVPDGGLDEETVNRRFRFRVDYANANWAVDCGCYRGYLFYVQRSSGGAVKRFKVRAFPSGRVQDQRQRVNFDVSLGSTRDSGAVNMPLAGAESLSGLARDSDAKHEVYLRGASQLRIPVKNLLLNTEIVVEPAPIASDFDDRLWAEAPKLISGPITIKPLQSAELIYEVQPRPWAAVERSFFKVRPTDEHASIRFSIPYKNPTLADRSARLDIQAAIRFKPLLLALVAGLTGGWFLGSIAKLLQPKQRTNLRLWMQSSATGLVAAIIVELIALFMVAMQSKFVFFTFDLDPWQTFPTVIIGLVCGLLGDESFAAMKRLLKLEGAAPHSPQPQPRSKTTRGAAAS